MLLNQPSRLPFPHDSIVPGNDIPDPNSYDFPIPQSGPEAIGHLRFIAAKMCTLLTGYRQSGYISAFAYNLLSSNRFSNEAWMAVIADTYDFATKLATANPGSDITQVLSTAVTKYYAYAVANCVNRYPELTQVVPLQMVNNAIQAVNTFRGEVQALDVHLQRIAAQRGNQFGNNGLIAMAAPQPSIGIVGGGIENMMTSLIATEDQGIGSGWGRNRRPSAELAKELQKNAAEAPAPVIQQYVAPMVEQPVQHSLVPTRRRPAAIQQDDDVEPTVVVTTAEVSQPEPPVETETIEVVERPQFKVRETPREAPTYTENPQFKPRVVVIPENMGSIPDSIEDIECSTTTDHRVHELIPVGDEDDFGLWVNDVGELVKVVSADNTGWSMSLNQLTRTLYNPAKWHRALIQQCTADNQLIGPISEGFIPVKKGDPMEYLDLELDPAVRARALLEVDYNKRYIPVKGEVIEISVAPTVFGFNGSPKEGSLATPKERQVASYALNKGQRKPPTLACIELACVMNGRDKEFLGGAVANELGVKIRLLESDFVKPSLSKESGLSRSDVEDLLEYFFKTLPALGKEVDQILTEEVNVLLMHGFGLQTLEIESFYGDYEELLDALEEGHGIEARQRFNDSVKGLLRGVYWGFGRNELTVALEGMSVYLHGTVTDYGVTLVSSKLGMAKTSSCGTLVNALNGALASLVKNADLPVTHVSFTDGDTWRVVPSIWDENHLTFVKC